MSSPIVRVAWELSDMNGTRDSEQIYAKLRSLHQFLSSGEEISNRAQPTSLSRSSTTPHRLQREAVSDMPSHFSSTLSLSSLAGDVPSSPLPFTQNAARRVEEKAVRRSKLINTVRASELQECTFSPKVSAPSAINGTTLVDDPEAVYKRSQQWEKDVARRREKTKEELTHKEMEECHFQPRISARPRNVSARRGRPEDRLADAAQQKERHLAQLKRDAAAQEMAECTFRPRTVGTAHVAPRYMQGKRKPAQTQPDFDFQPTLTARPRSVGRRLGRYLDTPAHERLSRVTGAGEEQEAMLPVFSLKSPLVAPQPTVIPGSDFLAKSKLAPSPEEPKGEKPKPVSTPQSMARFLARQERTVAQREQSRQKLEQLAEPSFCPTINATSQRLAQGVAPIHKRPRRPVPRDAGRDFPFKPTINEKSAKMGRARSPSEMVTDGERRLVDVRRLATLLDRKTQIDCTFAPTICATAQNSRGRLGVDLDTQEYIADLRARSQAKERRAEIARLRREADETAGCTFKPVVRDVPSFIKAITEKRKHLVL